MDCNEFQLRIAACIDGQLPASERRMLDAHLATCRACQSLTEDYHRLDTALLRALAAPSLPADFEDKLQTRLTREGLQWTDQQRLERKQRLQLEFDAALAHLNRSKLARFSDLFLGALLAGAGAWLLCQLALPLATWLAGRGVNIESRTLMVSLLASTGFLAAGLAAALPAPAKRWWAAIAE